MKVAIFHDHINAIGGAERLVFTLARALDADIITTDVDPRSIDHLGFGDVRVISLGSTVRRAPIKQIQTSLKFALCSFPGYDFYLFSGNWAQYAAIRHTPNLWYCHTPVRAFYDLKSWVIDNQKNPFYRFISRIWISVHTHFDQRIVHKVNRIVTNSHNTRRRIHRFYSRDARVIYPPIATGKFRYIETGSYWLSVNRLYPEKRIELQIEAFSKMPEQSLVIVGSNSHTANEKMCREKITRLSPATSLHLSVSDEQLGELYGKCRGFVCTAIDEDFGMTPLEAMSAGKPVVAVRDGGYCESVVDGVTGMLVAADVDSIITAVREIEVQGYEKYRTACRKHAEIFDEKVFLRRMKECIDITYKEYVKNQTE